MDIPSFSLVMSWPVGAAAGPAAQFIEALGTYFPSANLKGVQLSLPAKEACLQLTVEFTPYPQAFIKKVAGEVEKAGGSLVELWRMSKPQREAFRREHLLALRDVTDFATSAAAIRAHLAQGPASAAPRSVLVPPPPESPAPSKPADPPQRQSKRFEVQLDVEFQTEMEFVLEHATNISNGGMFVRTGQRPPVDTLVELRLKLPNGEQLTTAARVAHVHEGPDGGVGVEFAGDDPQFDQAIDRYIASLA